MSQPKLKIKSLGSSGVKVSEICLGAMTFTSKEGWMGMPSIDEEQSFQLLDRFIEVGGNFIDTANIYGHGKSEQVLGHWMESRNNRENVVLATKFGSMMDPNQVNGNGGSRRNIVAAVEESLERLKTNYIDLYQLHVFDYSTSQREVLMTLNDLVRCGKVRYIGCSNFNGAQVQQAVDYAMYYGLEGYVSLQPQYSLLSREIEYELVPVCQENGLGIIPWSPLKGGWLTGKYKRGNMPEEGRLTWAEGIGFVTMSYNHYNNNETWTLLEKIEEIAKELKASVAQVSLRWIMQKSFITSPIIGVRTMEQLNDNLGSAFIHLSDQQMSILDNLSEEKVPPYPYDFLKRARNTQIKT